MNREEVKQLKVGDVICFNSNALSHERTTAKPMECLRFRHFTGFSLIDTKCGQTVSNWVVQIYPPKHDFSYQTKRFMNYI